MKILEPPLPLELTREESEITSKELAKRSPVIVGFTMFKFRSWALIPYSIWKRN